MHLTTYVFISLMTPSFLFCYEVLRKFYQSFTRNIAFLYKPGVSNQNVTRLCNEKTVATFLNMSNPIEVALLLKVARA